MGHLHLLILKVERSYFPKNQRLKLSVNHFQRVFARIASSIECAITFHSSTNGISSEFSVLVRLVDTDKHCGTSCPGCEEVIFCDQRCLLNEINEVKGHTSWVCTLLRHLNIKFTPELEPLDDDEKTSLRWILAAFQKSILQNSTSSSNFNSSLEPLLSLDKGERPYPPELLKSAQKIHYFITKVISLEKGQLDIPHNLSEISLEIIEDLLSVDSRNTFGIMAPFEFEGERKLRATATYFKISMFNHSCYPNVARWEKLHFF